MMKCPAQVLLLVMVLAPVASFFERSKGTEHHLDVAPMIMYPRSGGMTCQNTIVRIAGIEDSAWPRAYYLDGKTIIPIQQTGPVMLEFQLFSLSAGPHTLEVLVFRHEFPRVVAFQHWLIFFVNADCDHHAEAHLPDNRMANAEAHKRFHFHKQQLRSFLYSNSIFSHEEVYVPSGMLFDPAGFFVPSSMFPENQHKYFPLEQSNISFRFLDEGFSSSSDQFERASIFSALERAAVNPSVPFVMVDLGAGWGRWALRAVFAGRKFGIQVRTLSVEAEPTHFEMLQQAYDANNLLDGSGDHQLVRGAAGATNGFSRFNVGSPYTWWGQQLEHGGSHEGTVRVRVFSLQALLQEHNLLQEQQHVDLMHLDIQGTEWSTLAVAAEDGTLSQIKAIFVATHSHTGHTALLSLFCGLGWHNVLALEPTQGADSRSLFFSFYDRKKLELCDGIQVWVNPDLVDIQAEFGAEEAVGCEGMFNTWPPMD